ncbi:hypothetical protein [Flagellimonas marina]|uniref:Uncharacterized protein n=1 Tax=Flagellimonas marina TaxID=1775168 RepID=A0ABV8PK86_9FLAO
MNFDKEIEKFATDFRKIRPMNEDDMDALKMRLKWFALDVKRKSIIHHVAKNP